MAFDPQGGSSQSQSQSQSQMQLNPWSFLLPAAGVAGGMFANQNPANAAQGYFNQIPGEMSKYLNPYVTAGQGAMGQLQGQYGNLVNNPGGFVNQMGQGYQQSPGLQFQENQSLNAANRAAAAGGMLGSPAEQQGIATTVNGLANQDYYNWLNHSMGAYGQGLSGLQGINQQGFMASTDLADSLAQALMSQGNAAYAGAANQNQSQGGGLGSIGSLLGMAASIPGVGI